MAMSARTNRTAKTATSALARLPPLSDVNGEVKWTTSSRSTRAEQQIGSKTGRWLEKIEVFTFKDI